MTCEVCAFEHGENCKALTHKKSGECSFAKTQQQLDAGRKKAADRLRSLPKETQTWINDKYYRK